MQFAARVSRSLSSELWQSVNRLPSGWTLPPPVMTTSVLRQAGNVAGVPSNADVAATSLYAGKMAASQYSSLVIRPYV